MRKPSLLLLIAASQALLQIASPAAADNHVKIHNVEFPHRLFRDNAVEITVGSNKSRAECIAYRDGVPVGSAGGLTTAGIAKVVVHSTKRAGRLTVRCF